MKANSHFIQGQWIEGDGEEFSSTDPATGETNWTGRRATRVEVDQAIEAASISFCTWSSLGIDKRISYLKKFGEELKKYKERLAEVISKETGKPLWESLTEVGTMIGKIPISIEAYKDRCGEKKQEEGSATLTTHHKPHGVVAVFGPFNFPGHLPNGHIIPALVAGNTVVLKNSKYAPLVAQEVMKCWETAGLPKGVINLIQGDQDTGQYLAAHQDIDGLFFTGSYKTGMLIAREFLHHPEKILALEMGGNNPLVVMDVLDLQAAAYLTIQSAYITSGQRCSCARRLIIMEGKEGDAFVKTLIHIINAIAVGAFTQRPEPYMGPVIHMQSMESLLETEARLGAQGGNSLVEMKQLKKDLPFLSPGLMDVTRVAHRLDEEIFGPFLQVIRVPSFDAAIKEANNTKYGLSASLLSQSEEQYKRFFQEVKAGVINWNTQTTGASSKLPFGGVGKSGNHRPSAYLAADYCVYPVASIEKKEICLPKQLSAGIKLLVKS